MPPKSPRTNKSSPEPRARSPPHEVGRSASSRSERAGWGVDLASPPRGEVGQLAKRARRVGRRRQFRLPTQWGGRRAQRAGWGGGANFASPRSGEVGARSAPGGEAAPISPPHPVGRSARAARRVGRRRQFRLPTQWGGRRAQRAGWGGGANFASPPSGEVGARSAPGGEAAPISPPHPV